MTQIFEIFHMTQRIEPLVMNLFSIWLKEMKFCFFFILTQRIETLCFSQNVSKNWTSLSYELLFYTTQRIDFFQYDAKIFSNWLKRVELTFFHDSKKWPCFSKMTHRIEPLFWMWRKEWNPFFFEYDAKNWILFLWIWRKELKALFIMTRRIEPSRKLLKDLNLLFLNLTQRIEPFFESDSKFENFGLKNSQNIELFPKNYDSKNWFFSQKNDAKFFFFENLIRRMEPSWKYDFQTKTWLK